MPWLGPVSGWFDSYFTLVLLILRTGVAGWRPGVPYQAQGAAQEELHPHERAALGAGARQRGREASGDGGRAQRPELRGLSIAELQCPRREPRGRPFRAQALCFLTISLLL